MTSRTKHEYRELYERLTVQLAGCLTAAEGHTEDVAKQGDYGWSPAYQAVLDLRRAYDRLKKFGALSKQVKEDIKQWDSDKDYLDVQRLGLSLDGRCKEVDIDLDDGC